MKSACPVLFSCFGNVRLAENIQHHIKSQLGELVFHVFPDEETSIQVNTDVAERSVIFVVDLLHPNAKILPLLFAAETVRSLGATEITLICPYLPYMRQDKQFHSGESITSRYFAKLLSPYFDRLVTIDPHLHRIHHLNEIYTTNAIALHATSCIAQWIKINVPMGILIGPDEESAQWVSEIAQIIDMPFTVLKKMRHDDNHVDVSMPEIEPFQHHTPILVDDIISTAKTMIETIRHLNKLNMRPPVCIGVHALFSGTAYQDLLAAGVDRIVTCNTIEHVTNQIDVSELIIEYSGVC